MKRAGVGFGLVVVAMCVAGSVSAVDQTPSVFARLDRLEEDAMLAARGAENQVSENAVMDEAIRQTATQKDVAARAARPIQRKVAATLTRWLEAVKPHTVDQEGSWKSKDTERLLLLSASRAIAPQLDDLHVLQRVDEQASELQSLVMNRAYGTVILAQHKASSELRKTERDVVLKSAKTDPGVRDDLRRADANLHTAMSTMLKYETDRDFHRLKGTLIPPVSAAASFGFGVRPTVAADVTVRHTGMTYRVPKGTSVKSAADGMVIYAHTFEGYGQIVILDHGGGYHSLYAHLDRISVKAGQRVDRQFELGVSGESGSLEGPKLYFELRHLGQAIDPNPWFISR
jgi:murein DD-endopeptidase MepM/ murein hydrolase activator NlpD